MEFIRFDYATQEELEENVASTLEKHQRCHFISMQLHASPYHINPSADDEFTIEEDIVRPIDEVSGGEEDEHEYS